MPCLKPKDWNSASARCRPCPAKSLTQARSALGDRSLVSMRWASAPISCSMLALGSMHSGSVRLSSDSGWRRRVSEKRLTSVSVLASRNSTRRSTLALPQLGDRGGQLLQRRAAAHVHAHGDARVARLRAENATTLGEQIGRQVVHAVVAAVLQHIERHALARARHPGDQDQPHGCRPERVGCLVHGGLAQGSRPKCCSWRWMNSCVLSMPRSCRT